MAKLKLTEKAKLQQDTKELLTAVFPIPKEVLSFYKKRVELSIGKGYEFAEVITKQRNGRLLQRVFCFQVHGLGGRKASMRECARRYEGGDLIVSNIKGGWYQQPYLADDTYEGAEMHLSGWSPKYAVNAGKKNFAFSMPSICLNQDKWLKEYPYCAWDKYNGKLSFWQYLVKYRKENRVELLVKAGYSSLVGASNLLNINGKNFEQIFKVKQEFAKDYLKSGTRQDLITLQKNEWIESVAVLNKYKQINRDNRYYKHGLSEEEIKYISLSNGRAREYKDYLRFAKELAYPLDEKRYRFPEDLKAAHDKANGELEVIKQKIHDEAIQKLHEECKSFSYEKDGYCIFPISCSQDLIDESKILEHCVRHYIKKCAEGKSLILFVRKSSNKETPYVTIELVKSKEEGDFDKITQVSGFKNSVPDKDTCKFIMNWKKNFKLKGWKEIA